MAEMSLDAQIKEAADLYRDNEKIKAGMIQIMMDNIVRFPKDAIEVLARKGLQDTLTKNSFDQVSNEFSEFLTLLSEDHENEQK